MSIRIQNKNVQNIKRHTSTYPVAGTDGFIGEASAPPLSPTTKDPATYSPPRIYPSILPIFCTAGNYELFMWGCTSYLAELRKTDIFPNNDNDNDNDIDNEAFQRLTDIYNTLDHPQSSYNYSEIGATEKVVLDLVYHDEHI